MSLLTAALEYARKGWRVFPCHTPITTGPTPTCSCKKSDCKQVGKHPRTMNGFTDGTTDPAAITRWWTMWPDANIGGLPASAGLVAFDLDSEQSISSARALGLFAEPTFTVQTGNGEHRYFQSPPLPSGAMIGGIIVRSAHGYVMLPPSLHASGKRYEVADATDPIPLPPLALEAAQSATSSEGARERVKLAVHSSRIAPGDRHGALLSLAGSLAASNVHPDTALELVLSHNEARCDPPKPVEEVRKLVEFAFTKQQEGAAGIARHLILSTTTTRPTVPALTADRPTNPLDLPLPGVLESMVQWSLSTAPHPVRLYAVAAALGVASAVCARRYTTSRANYSSLYFLVVGKSGTGKEHVRRTASAVLRASGAERLIGPNEWTSRSAVWSSVHDQPQSLAVVDEFGQFLGAASGGSDGAAMKNGVLTALMELFSRVDDVAITPQFSTLSLTAKQKKAAARKAIERPALSLIGLTTPNEWYDSLKGNRISSGFLNRFLVLETDTPRGDLSDVDPIDPPHQITDWVRAVLHPHTPLDLPDRAENIPAPRQLTITPDAHHRFREFKRECNARADLLEAEKLGELPMRAAEQAMRLALIASLADDPSADRVEAHHAEWAVSVASYQLSLLVPAIQERLSDSPVHALRNRFLVALKESGVMGMTGREIARHPVFRGAPKRDREETVTWVQEAGLAAWGDVAGSSVGGRPRFALRVLSVLAFEEAA